MNLMSLKLQNFLSYKDTTLNFNSSSVDLILGDNGEGGSNGSGKSAIFDAIAFALFGDTLRKIGKDDIVRKQMSGCEVTLVLEDEANKITVTRERSVSKQSTKLNVNVNGTDVDLGTIKDTQNYLCSLIGLDFSVFRNSILFGQNEISEFIEGADKFRKDLISKVFRFDKLDKCLDKVKTELVTYTDAEMKIVGNISALKSQAVDIPLLQKQEEQIQAQVKEAVEQFNKIKGDITNSELTLLDLGKAKQQLTQIQEAISSLEKEINHYKLQTLTNINLTLSTREGDLRQIDSFLSTVEENVGKLQILNPVIANLQKLDCLQRKEDIIPLNYKINGELTQINGEIKRISEQVLKMKSLDKQCPLCLSTLSDKHVKDLLDAFQLEIEGLKKAKKELEVKQKENDKELEILYKSEKDLLNAIQEKTYLDKSIKDKDEAFKQQERIKAELAGLKAFDIEKDTFYLERVHQLEGKRVELAKYLPLFDQLQYEKVTAELNNLKTQLGVVNSQIQSVQFDLGRYKEMIERGKKVVVDLAQKEKELNSLLADKRVVELLCDIFGKNGVKTYFVDNVLPLFQDFVNEYLLILTGGKITVALQTQIQGKSGDLIERFEVLIHTGDDTMLYDNYSGGEKRRISIAIRFALARLVNIYLGVKLSFLLLDETTDSLDDIGYDSFITLLNEVRKEYRNILVISHDQAVKDKFDSVLLVQKREGISFIE